MRVSLFVPVALIGLLPLACESNPPPQDASNMNGQCPPGQYCPPPTNSATQPYPTATATTPDPNATATAPMGQATPITGPGALAADTIMTTIAQGEDAGQPEGTAFAGQFQEGQILEQAVNLQPGKCYTIVAASVGPVQEVDIMIQGQLPPLPPATLAQDQGTGPTATLGGKAGCWKFPSPVAAPAKVVLRVTKGSGMAAAKVYVK